MAFSSAVGGMVMPILIFSTLGLGLENCLNTNLTLYVGMIFFQFSHSHNPRLTTIILPFLPDNLNFTAYHYVHHVYPNNNFSLTVLANKFWDRILGVSTQKT